MSDYMNNIRNIKMIYLKIGKERIYFDDIYSENGNKVICIQMEFSSCPIDVVVNDMTFGLSSMSVKTIKLINDELVKIYENMID
jgi:hypothetical protein